MCIFNCIDVTDCMLVGEVITGVTFTRRSWAAPAGVLNNIQYPGVEYIYIYIDMLVCGRL